jgi:anti-sigma regulatory factor (Ser/Thr protein kinase)
MRPAEALPPETLTRCLPLGDTRAVVHRSRRFTRAALSDWNLPGESTAEGADVLLLVSELVTNAFRHARGPRELWLTAVGPRVRIGVRDASPTGPYPCGNRDGRLPGGHGLFIVARLSADWGWHLEPGGGKQVWAEVALRVPEERRGAGVRGLLSSAAP